MGSLLRLIIRITAFFRKEIYEILRQPRLIISLVLGPFLILFLFGIGYRNEPRALRTMFVLEPGSAMEEQIEQYASTLGEQLIYVGSTADEAYALRQLEQRRIDLVAVAPEEAFDTIQNNEQAVFTLYHNEIDPFQADYVRYFGRIYIDEVNRRVLQSVTDQGQDETVSTREDIASAQQNAAAMREALERGDALEARQAQRALDADLDSIEGSVGTTVDLLDRVQQTVGSGEGINTGAIRQNLSATRESTTELGNIPDGQASYEAEAQEAAEIEQQLSELDGQLANVQRVDSQVLVSPFRSETEGIATVQPELADYFAPAVVVLLLQHLAVTFAALSIVREVQLGTIELFRVSPITAGETLAGKYLSYLLFGAVIMLILTSLIVFGLGVPMNGAWPNFILVALLLLFASLGYGFVISLIVDTDSQAVQYAMIILLTSVFFSGFFLSLQTLWLPVRVISWMLPATYAIQLLQNIMLRGNPGEPLLFMGLLGMGTALYVVAWLLMRRSMAQQ